MEPLLGIEPESVEANSSAMRRVEIAPLGPGRLTVTSQVNRVDWSWQPAEESIPDVHLGMPDEAIEQLMQLLCAWIHAQKDVVRVALGGVFGVRVETREEGYSVLDELIPELKLDASSSEFIYQINRPLALEGFEGLSVLNRIEKWSCRRAFSNVFALSNTGEVRVLPEAQEIAIHAACELDFNTDAQNTQFLGPDLIERVLKKSKEQALILLDRNGVMTHV